MVTQGKSSDLLRALIKYVPPRADVKGHVQERLFVEDRKWMARGSVKGLGHVRKKARRCTGGPALLVQEM